MTKPMVKQKDNELAALLKRIQTEKEQIESIIAQTEALEVEQTRRRQLNNASSSKATLQKQIHMLENRLNDALVKFNTKVQENKKLRDLIGEKRRDRCLYDDIYRKLEFEIQAQKQQMRRGTRERQETVELREQAEANLAIAKKELQESTAALETDRKELNDLREKIKEENGKERPHSLRPKTTPSSSSSAEISEEKEQCDEDMDDIFNADEKALDGLLEKVMQLSGYDNVDTLIEHLSGLEEQNLSRFQYITELEAEVGRVEDDIINATKELERMKNKELSRHMEQLKERDLAKQSRQKINEKVQALDKEYELQVELWEKMRTGIAHAHNELGLPMPDALLGSDGVNESNVFAYLAEVEKRITEIISAIDSDYDDDEGATSPSPIASLNRCSAHSKATATLNLNLPCVKDAPADDGDRPFTFDEIKSSLRF